MIGCLCVHGFTGGPFEVEPLVNYLETRTNWHIEMVTLPGHGEQLNLKGVGYEKWIQEVEENIKDLQKKCNTIYLIGFSMGGIISAHLATKYPINKLVLLSAAAYYLNPKQMLIDVKDMTIDGLRGNLAENVLYKRYRKKFKETPISATFQFQKLVKALRPSLQQLDIPTLVVQGEIDGVVPKKSADYIYQTIPTNDKELLFLENSKHHVCHDADQHQLFAAIERFLRER
ncbi:alpha/beta hydrolase [Bacillus sp. Marseille-P3661]|uniref:alpha/beta hydrolase n=1 Tax=Bacillus sp. Marseille-P3661 TaxID=1936234 RepID=UPI000C8516CA|nr:alpha/beta fold hydrolase [Bacillus sp. Marseille-P3661]